MLLSCKLVATLAVFRSIAQVRGQESAALRGTSESPTFVRTSQVLIFDAGSSGTRIHVFNIVDAAGEASMPRIDLAVRDKQTKKIKPGLSKFAESNDFAGCERSIEELLEFANQWVPAGHRSWTPALLKATAGLRAVKPAEKATAILERVQETLMKSGYLFKPEWADIIKGKEEAGLAWVAANYLQGSFTGVQDKMSSLGVIEMGGGSTQVTFEVSSADASKVVESDSFTFKNLAGQPYHLYAHSYLGYGQDHAQAKMRTLMPGTEVEDPCYPVGYVRQSLEDASKIIQGTGNTESCQELIRSRLLDPFQSSAPGRYPNELSLRGQFVATENFFYVRDNMKLQMDGSNAAMKEAAKAGCETPLNPSVELDAAMRAGTADPSKQNSCFALSYQVTLLAALQASMLPGVGVQIARNINGGDVDWALGAALMHFIDSGMGNKAYPVTQTAAETWTRLVILWLLMVAVLGFARFFCMGPKCSKQVAVMGSAVRATTLGRNGWIEVATKNGEQRSAAE